MDLKLIIPRRNVLINPTDTLFFLAGPILGGDDWQKNAILYLSRKEPDAFIACPCNYGPTDIIFKFALQSDSDSDPLWPDNTSWERHYLKTAGKQGAIIFWLPKESRSNPRPRTKGPYARDTYGELGEWRARTKFESAKVVVGAEPEFPGLEIIKKNFSYMIGEDFVIHPTLEKTLDAAIELV